MAVSKTHPEKFFDTATAFLCLNFVPDDGHRLGTLWEIHARLKPGAPFLMINGCTDKNSCLRNEIDRLCHISNLSTRSPEECAGRTPCSKSS
jgi:hypothetical protein